jgi:hypothetical protein
VSPFLFFWLLFWESGEGQELFRAFAGISTHTTRSPMADHYPTIPVLDEWKMIAPAGPRELSVFPAN